MAVLLIVSFLAFLVADLMGDPVTSLLGMEAAPAAREALRQRLGLDQPFLSRYWNFLANMLSGNFGISYTLQQSIATLFVERLPATVELAVVALLLSLGIGIPLGLYAAIHNGQKMANALLGLSIIGISVPTFIISIVLIFTFAVWLGWLPSFGRGELVAIGWWKTGLLTASGIQSLILPAITLSIGQISLVARLSRGEMLEVLRTDYIRFARARGLKDRTVHFSHALRNTLIPLITMTGIQLGYLVTFAIVVESVFRWPGFGLLLLQGLTDTDVPLVSAFLMLVGLIFVTTNLVVDILYLVVDPRLRASLLESSTR